MLQVSDVNITGPGAGTVDIAQFGKMCIIHKRDYTAFFH